MFVEIAGDEIVDRDDAMTFREQPVGQMRAEKSGAAGHNSDGLLAGKRGHSADYLNAGVALGEQKRAGAIRPKETRMQKVHRRHGWTVKTDFNHRPSAVIKWHSTDFSSACHQAPTVFSRLGLALRAWLSGKGERYVYR